MNAIQVEPHLSYIDLALRWNMPVQTLRVYVMKHKLRPLKIGRHVRFPMAYILEIEEAGGIS